MPNKSDRRQPRKFRRTAKRTSQYTAKAKHSKRMCVICGNQLHGVPHGLTSSQVRKLSKTMRSPSAPLAGMACGNCRTILVKEAIKVKTGIKGMKDVMIQYRPYLTKLGGIVE